MTQIWLDRLESDEGTIVVFSGTEVDGDRRLWVAVDHRMAQPIADAIEAGELPLVEPEGWEIIREER